MYAQKAQCSRFPTAGSKLAKALHLQHLEKCLDLEPFLNHVEQVFSCPISDGENISDTEYDQYLEGGSCRRGNETGFFGADEERYDKSRFFNFTNLDQNRLWLRNVLISDSSDYSSSDGEDEPITEEHLQNMLRHHLHVKKLRARYYNSPENCQYQYYGSGFLSNFDKFPEHEKLITGAKRKRKDRKNSKKVKRTRKQNLKRPFDLQSPDLFEDLDLDDESFWQGMEDFYTGIVDGAKGAKIRKKTPQAKSPEVMAMRRRKIWVMMAKKELGKVQRARINNHKEMLTTSKRVAQYCMKVCRQKAMQSQKNMKETVWRAKRLTREMQTYWKRYDRAERETRRRQEKEAEEQRKLDGELMEVELFWQQFHDVVFD